MNYFFCFLKDFSRPELTVINNFAKNNDGLALFGACRRIIKLFCFKKTNVK